MHIVCAVRPRTYRNSLSFGIILAPLILLALEFVGSNSRLREGLKCSSFLPTRVILKGRHPERADSHENEVDTYLHFQSLQGTRIPRLFGEVAVALSPAQTSYRLSRRPTPGILVEYVKGESLHSLPAESWGLVASLTSSRTCTGCLRSTESCMGAQSWTTFCVLAPGSFPSNLSHSPPPHPTNQPLAASTQSGHRAREG